jgi:hypothetical protein
MTNNTDAATLRLRHAADEAICAWREIHAQAAFQLGSTDEFPRLAIAMTELQKAMGDEPTWRELFPEGRTIFYEGDDPETFAQEILAEFGFNPVADPLWLTNAVCPAFRCPPEHLDAIYGSNRWELGS